MEQFEIGLIFSGTYPPEAAAWCNKNGAFIEECEGGYVIRAIPEPSKEEVQADDVEQQLAELEARVQSLSRRMVLADLQGDVDEKEAIRAEYQKLMEELE